MTITFASGIPDAAPQIIHQDEPPAAAGPVTVREILQQLESIDGASSWHGAIYYASTADLELQRYRTARRLAAASDVAREQYLEKLRLFRESGCSMGCAWCMASFTSLAECTVVGTKLCHHDCARQFDEFVSHCDESVDRYELTDAGRSVIADDDARGAA